jgi:hypothetical protein
MLVLMTIAGMVLSSVFASCAPAHALAHRSAGLAAGRAFLSPRLYESRWRQGYTQPAWPGTTDVTQAVFPGWRLLVQSGCQDRTSWACRRRKKVRKRLGGPATGSDEYLLSHVNSDSKETKGFPFFFPQRDATSPVAKLGAGLKRQTLPLHIFRG